MKTLAILYHDVVKKDPDESGFPGLAAGRYKLTEREFTEHLSQLAQSTPSPFALITSISPDSPEISRLLTFDDGGASAAYIADSIEEHGWRGHFFITTDFIDKHTFLTSQQLDDLNRRGHIIGSHSCSHPPRISELPRIKLDAEWADSVARLSDILGEAVTTASVPGGFYSKKVAESASSAGITQLFTSEPTIHTETTAGCEILGRYNIYKGMSPKAAGAIVEGKKFPRYKQTLAWNLKKSAKRVARPIWERTRAVYFKTQPTQ